MANITQLLLQLEERGVELHLDGSEVVLRHYKGIVGTETLQELTLLVNAPCPRFQALGARFIQSIGWFLASFDYRLQRQC
jgi:hypothetical protein